MRAVVFGAALWAALGACAVAAPVRVVTTMSTLASLVEDVGGARVSVSNLVPVGASPETYQPTPRDVALLRAADLAVENGAGIETWFARTLASAQRPGLETLVCSAGLRVDGGNPHLWMDPGYAARYESAIRDALIRVDPAGRTEYERRAAAAAARLRSLSLWIERRIAAIPPRARAMIVFHDAWHYYARRFGLRVVGAIEVAPGREPAPREIAELIAQARANHVRAVFAEPEYNPKLAKMLADGAGITLVTDLYDDSLGTDPRVRDYASMLRYDTDTIVHALREPLR
jgi:ABC-type Zn uptake system ZnuABC Zn-binding protein ZnuA